MGTHFSFLRTIHTSRPPAFFRAFNTDTSISIDVLVMETVDQDAWAARVSARFAPYGVQTTHSLSVGADDEGVGAFSNWPCGKSQSRGKSHQGAESPPRAQPREGLEGEGTEMFPSCFYAQILSSLPDSHRSVSVANTPRASVAVAEGCSHKDDQRLASRIMTHTRATLYGGGTKGEDSAYMGGSVLAQAEAVNRELHEMLAWAQKRNQRARELRRQLEHSKLVRYVHEEVPSGTTAAEKSQHDD